MTLDVTFLDKPHGEQDKVEAPAFVPNSYEGSDDDDQEMVPKNSNVNNDFNAASDDLDSEEEVNFFDQEIDQELEVNPTTTVNPKVLRAIKICKPCTTRFSN